MNMMKNKRNSAATPAKYNRLTASKAISRPRNSSITPKPGSSGIPKLKVTSDEQFSTKNRISSETMKRISLVSSKITPSKFMTPVQNNKALFVSTGNSIRKQSTDTVRSSMGGKSRKEGFPVNDITFKSQCIDKILGFLVNNHYELPYNRSMLKSPTGKDFASIFNFIYKHLEPNYKLPQRFEDEIPRILKSLKYPTQMPKSSFVNVGSPHIWPSILAMLAWLIDLHEFQNSFEVENLVFNKDFSDTVNIFEVKLNSLVSHFQAGSDEESIDEYLQTFKQNVYQIEGINVEDFEELQNEEMQLNAEISEVASMKHEVEEIKNQCYQLNQDKMKLLNYIQELEQHGILKENERDQLKLQNESLHNAFCQGQKEIDRLNEIKKEQNLSSTEIMRIKNEANDIGNMINHELIEEKELKEQVWNCQMDISKYQKNMITAANKYNSLCDMENCQINTSNLEENIFVRHEEIVSQLKLEKRKVKEHIYELQNNAIATKAQKDKVQSQVQEMEKEVLKLQRKLKRLEEETKVTQEEISVEELKLNEDYEKVNEEISQIKRVTRTTLYEKEKELEDLRQEYDQLKSKVLQAKEDGIKFIQDVDRMSHEFVEWKEEVTEQFQNEILDERIKFLEDAIGALKECEN